MSRSSINGIQDGYVRNGYDYDIQCWVVDYKIQTCAHIFPCQCIGHKYQGQDIREVKNLIKEVEGNDNQI